MTTDMRPTLHDETREQSDVHAVLERVLSRALIWIFGAVLIGSWIFVIFEAGERGTQLVSWQTWDNALQFLSRLAGLGEANPAYLDASQWAEALRLAYYTLAMSVLAIGLSTAGAVATVMLAARPTSEDWVGLRGKWISGLASTSIRCMYIVSRAVPELIWAMLIVFVLTPGVLAAAVALALHNFGILGKLCAEIVEDIDMRPARALRTAGASRLQVLLYAIVPVALPRFMTFILYRWEVIIRATVIVGFVSAAGLGREFRLSMSFFQYTHVALMLLVYVILVVMVDFASGGLRRMAR